MLCPGAIHHTYQGAIFVDFVEDDRAEDEYRKGALLQGELFVSARQHLARAWVLAHDLHEHLHLGEDDGLRHPLRHSLYEQKRLVAARRNRRRSTEPDLDRDGRNKEGQGD